MWIYLLGGHHSSFHTARVRRLGARRAGKPRRGEAGVGAPVVEPGRPTGGDFRKFPEGMESPIQGDMGRGALARV